MSTATLPQGSPVPPEGLACVKPNDPERRTWLLATGAMGGAATLAAAVPFVSTLAPSKRARAMGAAVELDIAGIPPWRHQDRRMARQAGVGDAPHA